MRQMGRIEIMEVYEALQRGKTITQIHKETGYARDTIRKVKALGEEAGQIKPTIRSPQPSLLDPYKEYIRDRVQNGCSNTSVLFDEVHEQGYAGGRSILKDFVQPLRVPVPVDPVRRYETPAGRQAQCDWAKFGTLTYPDGTERPLWIFVLTLSYSRCLYIEFVHDGRQDTLFGCLERAFASFGSVPHELLSDNMKPMVIAHPPQGAVEWHPRFLDFMRFHGIEPHVAEPYRPQTKGKVERPIRYIRGNFWPRVRQIVDLADLNRQVAHWVATVADVRLHATLHMRPIDRRAEDVAAGTPWQDRPFWYGEEMVRSVYADGYVRWEGHTWAVGYAWIGQEVLVQRRPGGGIVIRHGDQVLQEYPAPATDHALVGDPGPMPAKSSRPRPAASSRGTHQAVAATEVQTRSLAAYEAVVQP